MFIAIIADAYTETRQELDREKVWIQHAVMVF